MIIKSDIDVGFKFKIENNNSYEVIGVVTNPRVGSLSVTLKNIKTGGVNFDYNGQDIITMINNEIWKILYQPNVKLTYIETL